MEEEPLLGAAVWMDEPAGGVEVMTTVCTTTEPLDCVEVDSLVTMLGVGKDTGLGVYVSEVVVGALSGAVVVQDVL